MLPGGRSYGRPPGRRLDRDDARMPATGHRPDGLKRKSARRERQAGNHWPMTAGDHLEALLSYYERGEERARLTHARGALEFERTKELVERFLPPCPAVVADIGGGPGHYSLWLAEQGYHVRHRDIVPLHVAELEEQRGELSIDAAGR